MNNLDINIDYSFTSGLGAIEEDRYIKKVTTNVYSGEFADNKKNQFIGQIDLTILLLDSAKTDSFDIYEIFDSEEYTSRLGETFYDFKNIALNKKIYMHYNNSKITNENVCFLETMSINSKYRGIGLGAKLFKDIIFHFKRDASLFVIEPFPLQFDNEKVDKLTSYKLDLKRLGSQKSEGIKKLTTHYQTWGFEKIKGIRDLLFFNTQCENNKFNSINFDDEFN